MRGTALWRLGGLLALLASAVWASSPVGLTSGIALYEAKKSEQAARVLREVLSTRELDSATRAQANLYLGLALSKLGETVAATDAFRAAFEVDLSIEIPFVTRAEIAIRAEAIRAETKARQEARAEMSEWASPGATPLPSVEPVVPKAPLLAPEAEFSAPPLEPAFVEPVLSQPPAVASPAPLVAVAPKPTQGRPPPARIIAEEVKVEPRSPDDGLHVGLGMRFLYNPIDEVLGPVGELTFGSQRGGRRLAALVTVFPGRQWGVGAALRLLFGPVIKRWRIEFGFDLGVIVYPSRLHVAVEAATQVLGFSFPVGPVRVKITLLNVALYANFFSRPMALVPAIGAGFGVEY